MALAISRGADDVEHDAGDVATAHAVQLGAPAALVHGGGLDAEQMPVEGEQALLIAGAARVDVDLALAALGDRLRDREQILVAATRDALGPVTAPGPGSRSRMPR